MYDKSRWPRFLFGVIAAVGVLCGRPSESRAEDEFILHPGYVTGTVSVPGHSIYRINITATAWDPVAQKTYSSTLKVDNQGTYTLVVEAGEWTYGINYYVYLDGNLSNYVFTHRTAAPAPDETVVVDLATDAVIEGTVSITGRTVHYAEMNAYSDAESQGHARCRARRPDGSTDPFLTYSLPIFGGDAHFRIQASSVRLVEDGNYDDFIGGSYEELGSVPVGGAATYDFHVDPGYAQGTVTVHGAAVVSGNVGAEIHDPATNQRIYSATTYFYGDGTYHFPVPPSFPGGSVRLYGTVATDKGKYGLLSRDVEIAAGETITNDWTIDLDGTISGDVVITGVNVDQIQIYGYGPQGAYRNLTLYTEGEYLLDGLVPGEWGIHAYYYDTEHDYQVGYEKYDYYYAPEQSVELAPGEDKYLDLSFTAGFIAGDLVAESLNLKDYLYWAVVQGYAEGYDYPTYTYEQAYARRWDTILADGACADINEFEMFVPPGTWQLRRFDLRFYLPVKSVTGEDLPYPQTRSYSILQTVEQNWDAGEYNLPWVDVGPGETVECGIQYNLGLIVPRLSSPDAVFALPRVDGDFHRDKDGVRSRSVSITASTNQGNTNEARVTLAAVPGWYELRARAYVQGSLVTFGLPFMVYVGPGDIVYPDVEGPEVFILYPPGDHVTHETCVDVEGSLTSDVEVTSLTINGTEVTLNEDGTFTFQVCGLQLGKNPLEVSASNVSGKSTTVIRNITRINDAPEPDPGGPYGGYEGSPVSFSATATDYENDALTFRWDFDGDGTCDATGATASHTWYDDHAGTVLIEVADEFNVTTGTAQVTIHNVAPAITAVDAPTGPVPRGGTFEITVGFEDPGTADTHTATFDWGDGTSTSGTIGEAGGSGTAAASYSYAASGPHEVTITVTDDDGGSRSTTVTVVVNTPPEAVLKAGYEGTEGSSVAFDAGGSSDADGDTIQFRWDFDGDGTWDTGYSADPTASFTWYDDHTGTVKVEVSDGDLTETATATVTVLNVAPVITALTATVDPTPVGTAVELSASFTDAGTLDTHAAAIQWGNGSSTAGTVTETGGSGTVVASRVYTIPGVYTLTCTVVDDDGGEASATLQYVVVYDPNGAFVTGGGQIDSPAGAYVADPALAGKATFGFVSKYQQGATVPTGNTSFRFHVADLMFKSTSYQWLVVAGAKAVFKGEGEIGGAGRYGFLLSAIDGELPGGGGTDRFRIRIWDKNDGDAVVYDNQMDAGDDAAPTAAITSGSIKVHKG